MRYLLCVCVLFASGCGGDSKKELQQIVDQRLEDREKMIDLLNDVDREYGYYIGEEASDATKKEVDELLLQLDALQKTILQYDGPNGELRYKVRNLNNRSLGLHRRCVSNAKYKEERYKKAMEKKRELDVFIKEKGLEKLSKPWVEEDYYTHDSNNYTELALRIAEHHNAAFKQLSPEMFKSLEIKLIE